MFFWFLGTAATTVWFVFRDDRFDYRVLFLGAVLADIVDLPFGGARVFHSVTASVALLAVVMGATINRREARRRWLALPIGTFLHLVFDGAFADPRVFWWPFGGFGFGDAPLPSIDRGSVSLVLEVVGIALLVRLWRMHGLGDASVRAAFLRDGRLVHPQDPPVGTC